jgi:hypothetical protein
MRPVNRASTFAALAAAAALTLTGCMANASSGTAGSPSAEATAPASATATPAPSTTASPATAGGQPTSSAPAPSAPASTPAPAPAGVKTFTFPEGRLSFKYPADWRVELFEASASPFVGTATVYDASGARQAEIFTGVIADGVSAPVNRTVFETLPVPGLQGQPAPAAHYSFYVDNMDGLAKYRMHVTPGAPKPGADMAVGGLIRIGDDRVMIADVTFVDNPFASEDAAKAWLAGTEGQALKALLMSISYS